MNESDYEYRMLEAFIDKPEKTQWYSDAFATYQYNGVDTMRWYWNWWAFGGGFLFLLYRKQYVPALGLFILSMVATIIPFGGLIVMILSGGYATYFVYQGYKEKKAEIEATIEDEEKRIETMRYVGGYHQWVIWVYIAVMGIVLLGIITAVLIPLVTASFQ